MVALAIVGLGRDDALDACRDALVHVYGVRHWLRIWQLFGSLGLAWAERDVLEPASVVETSDPGASRGPHDKQEAHPAPVA